MTDGDRECRQCGKSGSIRWMVTHGHARWSSWLLPWLGDVTGLLASRQAAGRRLGDGAGGKHRRREGTGD